MRLGLNNYVLVLHVLYHTSIANVYSSDILVLHFMILYSVCNKFTHLLHY